MKKAGFLLIILGVFSTFIAFNMDVIVGTSYNIGLLNGRQNIVYLSGILFLAGIILFGFGVIAKEESENLKAFVWWSFSTSIVLFITIKIILDIQAERQGTITFKSNELMWQKCSVGQTWKGDTCTGEATKMTWDEAMKLSESFAGYNDWRLPTKEELITLVFCFDGEYAEEGYCKNAVDVAPTINSMYFPSTQKALY